MVCTPYDKSTSTVVAIETLSEPRLVYNWTLEKSPHNYVANGILSHNKPKDQYP
jgi:intein/homing endonuclease